MLKRTTVKFLLGVLVMTGLAGTVDHASLTAGEKKMVIKSLKESRERLMNTYKQFSEKQAKFVMPEEGFSANNILDLQIRWEKTAWEKLKNVMRGPAAKDGVPDCRDSASNEPSGWTIYPPLSALSAKPDLTAYKTIRQSGIRYVRNSTENFKTHYVAATTGCVTGYQYLLGIIDRTETVITQLEKIRRHPQFPAE